MILHNNPLVSKYYDPLHSAVLQTIAEVVANAASFNRNICLCGEMATDPHNLLVLLGRGLREFSMPAPYIPRTKAFLAAISLDYARQAWHEVAGLDTSAEIHEKLAQLINAIPAAR